MAAPAVEQVAESAYTKLIFRIGMPAIMAAFLWLLQGYLANLNNATARMQTSLSEMGQEVVGLKTRTSVIETNASLGRAERKEFQNAILMQIDKIDDRIGGISISVASLSTRLDMALNQKQPLIPLR